MYLKVYPLSASFMLTSIVGAIISALYVYPRSPSFGFAFFLFFIIMFVASIISMTYAPLDSELDVRDRKRK